MSRQRAENLILISLDCIRPESLGCYGNTDIKTPAIDSIARESARFTQAVSQAPFTPASHASVFTGLNPNRHGIRHMIGRRMRPVPTLAEVFHSAGWSTAAFIGSSALSREYGLDRGFNLYDEDFAEKQTNWVLGYRRGCEESTSRVLDWIKNRNRFFLFLHYFDAHNYDGELVSNATQKRGLDVIDPQVQRILDHIRLSSEAKKTAVVIFSDHGDSITEHSENGHIEYLYDTTLRVPLIMQLPGLTDGSVIDTQISSVDIFPTLLDYFGLFQLLPEGTSCDGRTLVPLIRGESGGEVPPAFAETYMEAGQKKNKTTTTRYFAIRTANSKLIYERISGTWEAYDLEKDPDETLNVYSEDDPRFSELKCALTEYVRRGEKLEEVRMMSDEEGNIRRSLEALGYLEVQASGPSGDMAFYCALDEGKKLINLGKHNEAVEKLMQALAMRDIEEGLRSNARLCLAQAYRRLKDPDKALEQLETVLNGKADLFLSARAAVLMSAITAEEHSVDEGISVLDCFLETSDPLDPELETIVRSKRAALYRESRRFPEAIDDYQLLMKKSPQNIDACYNLGSLFKQMGDYSKALACFRQVLRISTPLLDKYHAGAHYHLADISMKRSLPSHAEKAVRQCLEINPTHGAAKEMLDKVASSAGQ